MTASVAGKPRAKRPTAAEKIAAAEAEAAELRRQLAARTVADAAPLPPSVMPANGSNGHKAAAIPEMLRFTTDDSDGEPEVRVPVFEVDGTEYTMPAKPGPAIGLRASHLMGERGISPALAEARATDYVLTAMLGEDGHRALLSLKKITRAQLRQIISIVTTTAMGAVEDDPKDA